MTYLLRVLAAWCMLQLMRGLEWLGFDPDPDDERPGW